MDERLIWVMINYVLNPIDMNINVFMDNQLMKVAQFIFKPS